MVREDIAKGYHDLANAVVIGACQDYVRAKKRLLKKPNDLHAQLVLASAENFLKSTRLQIYTTVDGGYLIRKLEESITNDEKRIKQTHKR